MRNFAITYTPLDWSTDDFRWLKKEDFRSEPEFTAGEINREVLLAFAEISPMLFYHSAQVRCALESVTLGWQRITDFSSPLSLTMKVGFPYPWGRWVFSTGISQPSRTKTGQIEFWWDRTTHQAHREVDDPNGNNFGLINTFQRGFDRIVPREQHQSLGYLIPQIFLWIVEVFMEASKEIADETLKEIRKDHDLLTRDLSNIAD